MKTRWLLTSHLIALIAAGLVTWWVFQPGADEPEGERVLLDLKADQIERLEYQTDKRQIVAEATPTGGFQLTIHQTLSKRVAKKLPPKPAADATDGGPADGADGQAADASAPPAAEPEVREETKVTRYRASSDFAKALARVLPLVAVRELGEVDAEQLERFGLAEPTGRLRITSRGQTVEYQVGERTYGRASVYLRPAPDGPVSLVSAGLLSTVDFRPPRFKELRFLGLQSKDVVKVVLDCDGTGSRTLVHQNQHLPGGGQWVPADDPDSADELFGNWMRKLLRLSLVEYLAEPVTPVQAAQCRLTFEREGAEALKAQITWTADPKGKQIYYGRSDFSGDWVKLEPTAASSLVSDLSAITGNGPAPKGKPAP